MAETDSPTQLPSACTELVDSNGGKYYLNTASGKLQKEYPNIAADPPSQLPSGWTELNDCNGGKYYLHTASGKLQKDYPTVEANPPIQLPSGWTELFDSNGGKYYLHIASGKLQKDYPTIAKLGEVERRLEQLENRQRDRLVYMDLAVDGRIEGRVTFFFRKFLANDIRSLLLDRKSTSACSKSHVCLKISGGSDRSTISNRDGPLVQQGGIVADFQSGKLVWLYFYHEESCYQYASTMREVGQIQSGLDIIKRLNQKDNVTVLDCGIL